MFRNSNKMEEKKNTLDPSVVTVLNGIELEKYISLFEKYSINMELFVSLTEEDLKTIGIEDRNDLDLLIKYIRIFQYNRNLSEKLSPLR